MVRRSGERWITVWADLKMSSTASAEGPLDVSGPVRGKIVVSLSAALRRHLWLQERAERVKRAVGGWWSRDEAYKGDCGCGGLVHRVRARQPVNTLSGRDQTEKEQRERF